MQVGVGNKLDEVTGANGINGCTDVEIASLKLMITCDEVVMLDVT